MLGSLLPFQMTSQLKQERANDVHIRNKSPNRTDKFVRYLLKSFSREETFHCFEKLYKTNHFGFEKRVSF